MSHPLVMHRERLTGWGGTEPTVAEVAVPSCADEVAGLVKGADSVIARGMGRSYNNAAQNDGGVVVSTAGLDRILSFDGETGLVTCEAGVSLEELMVRFLPQGWFVPVTPGTRKVSVGGAIAADVHGKNHHVAGSFMRHVRSFDLLLADGSVRTITPDGEPELCWATAGGMGLTVLVLRATVQLKRVQTSRLVVDTVRTAGIDETMDYLSQTDQDYDYTVAWTDCLATGKSLGRSVITSGSFAAVSDLPACERGKPFAFKASGLLGAPAVFPVGVINRLTVAMLNEAYFRKAPRRRTGEIQTIGQFFHPLDGIRNWNRVYGPAGFRQYQYVVPFEASDVVRRSLERISMLRAPSFVTVLKRFGAGDPGLLS